MIKKYHSKDRGWIEALYEQEVLNKPWGWDSTVNPLGELQGWDVMVDNQRRGFIVGKVYGTFPEISLWIVDSLLPPITRARVAGRLIWYLGTYWRDQGYTEVQGSLPVESRLVKFLTSLGAEVDEDSVMGRLRFRDTNRFLLEHEDKFDGR